MNHRSHIPIIILIIVFLNASCVFAENIIISKIIVEGNQRTKDYIIRRELTSRAGESLDENKLSEDKNRLLNMGIFSEVWLHYIVENDSATVFVIVCERISIVPFPLLYYDEMDGWSYGGGIYHRNFNGMNRTVRFYSLFGGSTQYYLTLRDPWLWGDRISFEFEIARMAREHPYENFHQIEDNIWIEVGKTWNYRLFGRIKAGFRRIKSDVLDMTLTGAKHDDIPFLKLTCIYDSRDLWINPSRGWRLYGKFSQNGIPREKPDFREFYFNLAHYLPMKWGRTMGINAVFAERNGPLPPYERYYFGGVYTVRGIEPNFAAGTRLFLASLEYRFDIIKTQAIIYNIDAGLGGTIFWDGGSVWSGGQSFEELKFHNGFGFGFRFFVPLVELIRVDFGWTVNTSYRIAAAIDAKF